MSKAKLSQIAKTWLHEDDTSKGKKADKKKNNKIPEEQPRKKQTFTLKIDTIKRLWMHRAKTGKTISETLDELVIKYIPNWEIGEKI
jgi:hypothetical protein